MPAINWKYAVLALLSVCLAAEPALAQRGGAPGGRQGGGGGGGFRPGGGGGGFRPGGGGGGSIGRGQAAPRQAAPRQAAPRAAAPPRGGIDRSPSVGQPRAPRDSTPRSGVGDGRRTTGRIPFDGGMRPGAGVGRPGAAGQPGIDRRGADRPGIDRRGIDRPGADRSDLTRRLDPGRRLDPDRTERSANRPDLTPRDGRRFDRDFDGRGRDFDRRFDRAGRDFDRRFDRDFDRRGRGFNGRGRDFGRDVNVVNNYYSPYRHSNWNVGYWNPGWNFGWGGYGYGPGWYSGPYGYYGYYGRPWGTWAALGLAAWALGANYYNLGYGYYGNPYYVSSYGGWNYAEPIPVVYYDETLGSTSAIARRDSTAAQEADQLFADARLEFRNGNYEQAMNLIGQAIEKTPDDPALHEFRALTLFALQRYPEASAAIYAVLAVAPGWNWSTLSSMYPSVGIYTDQLRDLENAARNHPDEPDTHFLLGYHYLTMGHADAARKQLEIASRLSPDDQVSRQLLGVLARAESPEDGTSRMAARPDYGQRPAPPRNDSETMVPEPRIVGEWKAQAQGDDSITLDLREDETFNWTLNREGKSVKHTGNYELEGDTLILDFADGGGMMGRVTETDDGFKFKMLNSPEDDPGLTFRQS